MPGVQRGVTIRPRCRLRCPDPSFLAGSPQVRRWDSATEQEVSGSQRADARIRGIHGLADDFEYCRAIDKFIEPFEASASIQRAVSTPGRGGVDLDHAPRLCLIGCPRERNRPSCIPSHLVKQPQRVDGRSRNPVSTDIERLFAQELLDHAIGNASK
jgi:hypothetical protein